jgi:hypothetical protein
MTEKEPNMAKVATESPKRPRVDLVGTYTIDEPTQKTNVKDGQTYTVAPGDYPVMALLSDDRKTVQNVGVMFNGANEAGERATIVDPLRPLDVPALAQSGQIKMEANADRSVRFPLAMFLSIPPAQEQQQSKDRSQAKEHAVEHSLRISA